MTESSATLEEVKEVLTETPKQPSAAQIIEDLSMSICKLSHAASLIPGTKEHQRIVAEAMALAEPYTPQVEDNEDDK